MKTIEDRAHEILLKLIETDKTGFDAEGIAAYSYEIAEAMQSEAEKRKATPNADPMLRVREAEWKPDWSQAPDWANWWAIDESQQAYWYSLKPRLNNLQNDFREYEGETKEAPSFNYQGDWKDSLRKRP